MLESIDRLNRLIEDLLLFSARRTEDTTELDLTGPVAETVSLARIGLGARPITLAVASDCSGPVVVRGSRERLIQVLTNVMLNATQATPDGGIVTVRLAERRGSRARSACTTPARSSRRRSGASCSCRSSPPSRAAPGSAWPSPGRSSPASTAASTSTATRKPGPPLPSSCRCRRSAPTDGDGVGRPDDPMFEILVVDDDPQMQFFLERGAGPPGVRRHGEVERRGCARGAAGGALRPDPDGRPPAAA